MIFLIQYDRPKGRIVTIKTFENSERLDAENSRLETELDLNRRGITHEVVLLEAASKDALRRTHQRYFEDLKDLKDLGQIAKSARTDHK